MNIKELSNKILYHSGKYYNGEAEIDDREFDKMVEELKEKDQKNSYFNLVGAKISNNSNKIFYDDPMLSISKTKDIEGILQWLYSIGENEQTILCCEPKIDGISCNLRYNKGYLQTVSTRGNGIEGSIIKNYHPIKNIPDKILYDDPIEIRGELYITPDNHQKYFQNKPNRNICSGLVNRMIHREIIEKEMEYVQFLPYWITPYIDWWPSSHNEAFKTVENMNDLLDKWFDESIKKYSVLVSYDINSKKTLIVKNYVKQNLK